MDDISSDSGIFCDSKLYHSYFRYNISFINPPLGELGAIFPVVMNVINPPLGEFGEIFPVVMIGL